MDVVNEILDAIEIIVDKKVRDTSAQIYLGVCKSVSGNSCVMSINGRNNTVQFYGSTPTVGTIYRVFVPNGNMSMAFIITGANDGSGSSGGSSSGVTSYTKLTELPSINGVILQEGATSKSLSLYGNGNEPNYPVTKVNGKTGEVTLTADDVGALPLNTAIPKKTSELTNDSGFITLAQVPTAPVQSVNGQTGAVVIDEYSLPTASDTVLGGIKVGSGLTINSGGVLSATGGGVADAVEWSNVQSKPTTVSGYGITDAKIDNGAIILGDNRITPVTSVNGQTGDVTLSKADVGLGNVPNVTTNNQTPTYTQTSSLANIISGEKLSVSMGKIMKAIADLISHLANKTNPHNVTKTQIGLGNVDNTSDADKPVSTSQATAIANAKKAGTDAQSNLSSHINNKSNPHNVTAEQIGVNNATLTIQKNGETVDTFTANSSVDKTVNIIVPTTPDDIGAISKDNISQTLGNSTTKVPSEKAVSDAMASAGGGDMLKSVYDPTSLVEQAGGISNYVDNVGGKINIIKVNGVTQTITNKIVDIAVPSIIVDSTKPSDQSVGDFWYQVT